MRLLPHSQRPRRRQAGGSSGQVPLTKYYRSGDPNMPSSPFGPPAGPKPKLKGLVVRLLDICLVLALIIGLGYSLLVKSEPRLSASSTVYRPLRVYQAAAAKELGAFKNRNKITLDEKAIIAQLQLQFPEISSATIELPLFSETPTLRLNIAPPSFFLASDNALYIIDSDGLAVAKNTDLPQIKNLQLVTDQSGFPAAAGKRVLSASNISFINSLIAQCHRAKVPLQSLALPNLAQELDVRTTDQPYFTKFFLGGDSLVQAGQFLAARHQFDTKGGQPSEYLDVRVPGKIFYK